MALSTTLSIPALNTSLFPSCDFKGSIKQTANSSTSFFNFKKSCSSGPLLLASCSSFWLTYGSDSMSVNDIFHTTVLYITRVGMVVFTYVFMYVSVCVSVSVSVCLCLCLCGWMDGWMDTQCRWSENNSMLVLLASPTQIENQHSCLIGIMAITIWKRASY